MAGDADASHALSSAVGNSHPPSTREAPRKHLELSQVLPFAPALPSTWTSWDSLLLYFLVPSGVWLRMVPQVL